MIDIGLGNINFKALQENKADAPLDINQSICKYPDFLKMIEDPYGDMMFFFARRESLYARHIFQRAGDVAGEPVPTEFYMNNPTTTQTDRYYVSPSGSLISSEQQLFNRPFWLQRAQGHNNGVLWHNECFITMVDTTRGTNFSINVFKEAPNNEYKNGKFVEFLRHCEEFQIAIILQLCKVSLTPENLAYLHTMDPKIIEDWHLAVTAPPNADLEDHYRYIQSMATKCPADVPDNGPKDPYEGLRFWDIDLTDSITEQLDQTSLGRKFLYQTGSVVRRPTKRVITQSSIRTTRTPAKRRRRT